MTDQDRITVRQLEFIRDNFVTPAIAPLATGLTRVEAILEQSLEAMRHPITGYVSRPEMGAEIERANREHAFLWSMIRWMFGVSASMAVAILGLLGMMLQNYSTIIAHLKVGP